MTTVKQVSMSRGVIAPVLHGRTDTTAYATGLRTARNVMVLRSGGVQNRPGTQWIDEIRDSSKAVRLVPWVFNSEQTYVVEMGDDYMEFIRSSARVQEAAQTITAVTQANPGVVTIAGHGYSNGDHLKLVFTTAGGMGQLANRRVVVAGVTANTFQLTDTAGSNINTTSYTAYTSGGTASRVYKITSPYQNTEVDEVDYAQSASTMYLTHPSYEVRKLTRTAHTSWTLATVSFAPSISAPTSPAATNGTAGAIVWRYKVTAVKSDTYEESLPTSSFNCTGGDPTTSAPNTLSWTVSSGAVEYNVYREVTPGNGIYGFIGVASTNAFNDPKLPSDGTDTPPEARTPFSSSDNRPSSVTFHQQRIVYANTNNNTEKVWTSRVGSYENLTISSPLQDDDAVTFTVAGQEVNEIRYVIGIGNALIVLTSGGEHAAIGDESGVLKPTAVNNKQYSNIGCAEVKPLVVGNGILYLQAGANILRDLRYDFQQNTYGGEELTIFSSHLLEGYTIVDMAYQKVPNSTVWLVRSDGKLLSLTYVKEHQVVGWALHDTDGTFENVCAVPEGDETALYCCVKRTINSATKRYIERFATRFVDADNIEDSIFMDAALTYDGWHAGSTTMTLSGGTTWAYDETLTLTASASTFNSGDVGNEIHLVGSDGTLIRFEITGYTGVTIVTGKPHQTVPSGMRSVAISTWGRAVDALTGLSHLEGESLSVFGDGFVVASPNNASYGTVTVSSASATLDRPYVKIHAGLPYISDVETLTLDPGGPGTMLDRKKLVSKVTVQVEKTRGLFMGRVAPTDDSDDPLENLYEAKVRNDEGYNAPVSLDTEIISVNIQGKWTDNGRVFIRQVDPIPMTLLSIAPAGKLPFPQG